MSISPNTMIMTAVDSTLGDTNCEEENKTFDMKNSSGEDSPSDGDPNSPLGPLLNDGEVQDGSESEGSVKKKRRRRVKGGKHHRKKWKPYNKLSWNERRELDERETARANQKREDAFASGHPVAPYNTTQFLMEDHIKNESISPDLKDREEHCHAVAALKESSESSEEASYSSCEEGEQNEQDNYMEKEFSETYNNMHAERLQMMSKDELIKDFLEVEAKLERLQKRYNNRQRRKSSKEADSSGSLSSGGEEFMDLDVVKQYEDENKVLKQENEKLKSELANLVK